MKIGVYKTILRVLFMNQLLNAEIMNCVLEHKIAMHKTRLNYKMIVSL